MQITRDGALMRNAYPFTDVVDRPTTVDSCSLFWRFLLFGALRTVLNTILVWVVALMVVLMPVAFGISFLLGRKMVLREEPPGVEIKNPPFFWQWMNHIPNWLLVLGYRYPIDPQYPRLFRWRVTPLIALLALGIAAGEVAIFSYAISQWAARGIGIYGPSSFIALSEIAALWVVALGVAGTLLNARARNSELWQLARVRYRSFKERTCAIIEVVG